MYAELRTDRGKLHEEFFVFDTEIRYLIAKFSLHTRYGMFVQIRDRGSFPRDLSNIFLIPYCTYIFKTRIEGRSLGI